MFSFNSYKTVFVLISLFITSVTSASKIKPMDHSKLDEISPIVVVGEVEKVEEKEKVGGSYTIHHVTVKKLCCIKGKIKEQTFTYAIRIGGVKGFDIKPEINTKYVLFLKPDKRKEGLYQLAYPKAMAKFVDAQPAQSNIKKQNKISTGPPMPFSEPKIKAQDAIELSEKYLKKKNIKLITKQYISSIILKHRDNSNDKLNKPMGHYWEIQWKLKTPSSKSKGLWELEVSMDGTVYQISTKFKNPASMLKKVIGYYQSANVKGIKSLVSKNNATIMKLAKNPSNAGQLKNMREFGDFLARTTPRWSYPNKSTAVASFGPEVKAFHVRFIKKDEKWLIDEINGGD